MNKLIQINLKRNTDIKDFLSHKLTMHKFTEISDSIDEILYHNSDIKVVIT